MAITKDAGRQDLKVASVSFTYADLGTAIQTNAVKAALDLPRGAVIVGGALVVTTAFVGPTACTVAIGDTGVTNRYLGTTSLLAAGRTALVPTGYSNGVDTVDLLYNSTVAVSTAGAARLEVQYFVPGRTESVYEL